MEYEFKLEWEELSEELRKRKVMEYRGYLESEDAGYSEGVDDGEIERSIRAHFPIYF